MSAPDPDEPTSASRRELARGVFDSFLSDHALSTSRADFDDLLEDHPDLVPYLSELVDEFVQGLQGLESFKDGADSSPRGAGDFVADFRLVRLLGKGGQGEVWEAEDPSLGRSVALKLIAAHRVDEQSLARFAREARTGGRLQHPGIVVVHGHGKDAEHHWIAQELVPGGRTVQDWILELSGTVLADESHYRKAAEFLADLARALEVAHQAGVIHRDLKPQNVLVSPEGRPKLTDFGLARVTDESALSETGQIMGTWLYMSPEQVRARRGEIDHRTDIFSLGVVMYELLALQRPFTGDTVQQIAQRILTWDPPNLRQIRSRVPRDLAVICAKALEKSPDQRYASMAELEADLRRHLANEPILAKPPGPIARGMKWAARNSTISVAAGMGVVSLAVVSIMAFRNSDLAQQRAGMVQQLQVAVEEVSRSAEQAKEERDRADEERDVAQRTAYVNALAAANLDLNAGRIPEARARLEATDPGRRGWEWDWLQARTEQSIREWSEDSLPVVVAVQPEGDTFFLGLEDWIITFDAASLEEQHRTPVNGELLGLSCDGALACVLRRGEEEATLELQDLRSSKPTRPIGSWPPTALARTPKAIFSPDNTRLLIYGWLGSPYQRSILVDATTGKILRDFKRFGPYLGVAFSPDSSLLAVGDRNGAVDLFEASSGQWRRRLEKAEFFGDDSNAFSLAFDDAGRRLAASQSHHVWAWDLATEEILFIRSFDAPRKHGAVLWTQNLAFFDAGRKIVGSYKRGVFVLDAATGEVQGEYQGHDEAIRSLAHVRNDGLVATASFDRTFRLWDVSQSDLIDEDPKGLGVHPNGELVVLGKREGTWFYDRRTGGAIDYLSATVGGWSDVAMSRDGRYLATASGRRIELWDTVQGARVFRSQGPPDPPRAWFSACCGFHPSEPSIVHLRAGGQLRVVSLAGDTREITGVRAPENSHGSALAFAPEWEAVLVAYDRVFEAWTEDFDELLWERTTDQEPECMEVDEDGSHFALGFRSGDVEVFQTETGERSARMKGHSGAIRGLAWIGDRLVSGSNDGTVRVWDPDEGIELLAIQVVGAVESLRHSPDGSWLAVSTEARKTEILSLESAAVAFLERSRRAADLDRIEAALTAARMAPKGESWGLLERELEGQEVWLQLALGMERLESWAASSWDAARIESKVLFDRHRR